MSMVDILERRGRLREPNTVEWRHLSIEEKRAFKERFNNETHGYELVDRALAFKFSHTNLDSAVRYVEPIVQLVRDTSHKFSIKGRLLVEAVASQNEQGIEALMLVYVSQVRGDTSDVVASAAMRLSGAYLKAKGLPEIPTFPHSNSPTL